jgi:hypothetical protein
MASLPIIRCKSREYHHNPAGVLELELELKLKLKLKLR